MKRRSFVQWLAAAVALVDPDAIVRGAESEVDRDAFVAHLDMPHSPMDEITRAFDAIQQDIIDEYRELA